jgi:hypothetical protein
MDKREKDRKSKPGTTTILETGSTVSLVFVAGIGDVHDFLYFPYDLGLSV